MIPDEKSSFLKEAVFYVFCWVAAIGCAVFSVATDKRDRKEFINDIKSIAKKI